MKLCDICKGDIFVWSARLEYTVIDISPGGSIKLRPNVQHRVLPATIIVKADNEIFTKPCRKAKMRRVRK